MADADKCYLNIPFKEYLKSLKLDRDGRLIGGQATLDRIADQEFDNYKTIERRINNPACAGGACVCSWAHIEANVDTVVLAASSFAYIDFTWGAIIEEEGGWTCSGGIIVPPDTSILYQAAIVCSFSNSSGTGTVQGKIKMDDNTVSWTSGDSYLPAGFSGDLTMSRLVHLDPNFTMSAILTNPVPTTRTMGVYMEMMAISTCCQAPYQ